MTNIKKQHYIFYFIIFILLKLIFSFFVGYKIFSYSTDVKKNI